MKKIFGFTLAEVLITLGIVGVVAALILPPVINEIKDREYAPPTRNELNAMYFNSNLYGISGSHFSNKSGGGNYAWAQVFSTGERKLLSGGGLSNIRCVRGY